MRTDPQTASLHRRIESLSPKRKALLEKMLRERGIEESARLLGQDAIERVPRSNGRFPLSSAQERLWFLEQIGNTGSVFNVHLAFRLKQPLVPDAFREAAGLLVARHEALRTGFARHAGEPYQYVLPEAPSPAEVYDVGSISDEAERRRAVEGFMRRHRGQKLDLEKGHVFSASLVLAGESEQYLLMTMHHLVADGWSLQLLLRDLLTLYFGLVGEASSPLPGLPVQYVDYAAWQRERLASPELRGQLDYWLEELADAPTLLALPTDRERPRELDYEGASVRFCLDRARLDRLKTASKARNRSLFMSCLTAYAALLSKYCGTTDLVIGTDIANRSSLEIREVVGFFINQLALRCRWSGNPTLDELGQLVRQVCLKAYESQDLPFNHLVEQLKVPRSTAHTPVFQTKLVIDNSSAAPQRSQEVLEPIGHAIETAEFDIEVAMKEVNGELEGHFRYKTALFDETTISEMVAGFLALLDALVERPDVRLSEVAPWAAEPAAASAVDAVAPRLPPRSLIDTLLELPAGREDATAVESVDGARSYVQLRLDVEKLAGELVAAGVTPRSVVGVCLPRGVDVLVAQLAVLRVGACYVPLDADHGWERIGYALADSGAAVVVTTPSRARFLGGGSRRIVLLDADWRERISQEPCAAWPEAHPSQPAYIIYTSGSTGRPKGVAVSLGNLTTFLAAMEEITRMSARDALLAVTTVAFDISGLELYLPLLCKAKVVIASEAEAKDSRILWDLVTDRGITVLQGTPATWRGLALVAKGRRLPGVRALCGGEALPVDLAASILEICESAHNVYGPTETTIWSSSQPLELSTLVRPEGPPLGRPIAGTSLYVLDERGQLQPRGVDGELCVAGDGVALGYWGKPALTAAAFVPDPFAGRPGARVYCTGDRARLTRQGDLAFLGRRDQQVKIRGYRIELGEVESVLGRHPEVAAAVAVAAPDAVHGHELRVFVTAKETPTSDAERHALLERVTAHGAHHLPPYMRPARIECLDEMPLTANGKVDRKALSSSPSPAVHMPSVGLTPPSTELEREIGAIWAEVLGQEQPFLEQDFFRCGGHSLVAIKLLDRIEDAARRRVPLQDFFRDPTLGGLARLVSGLPRLGGAPLELVIDPKSRYEEFPLSDLQQAYLLGRRSDLVLGSIATQNYTEIDVEDLDVERFTRAWNVLVARHDMLRAVFDRQGTQRILPKVDDYVPEHTDLSEADEEERAARLDAVRREMTSTVLPETRGPLYAIRITRLDARKYRIHICIDMLISDVLSNYVLFGELDVLYKDPDLALPPLELTFRDYMIAERRLRSSERYTQAREYWLSRLDDFPGPPDLPLDRNPDGMSEQRFARRHFALDAGPWEDVKRLSRSHGVSPTVTLLTAFAQVLATWSRTRRFALNLTLFNRVPFHEQVNSIVGDFTSSLLLEVACDPRKPFRARALEVQKRLWEDMDHMMFSGVSVIRELNRRGEGSVSMPVVFTSMLGMLDESGQAGAGGQIVERQRKRGEEHYSISQTSQVWLDHQVVELDGALNFVWDAVEDLFPPGLLDDMFEAYTGLLTALAREAAWATTACLVPESQLAVRRRVNATRVDLEDVLLHELFERSADRFPDKEAVVGDGLSITYRQLETWSNALAAELREANRNLRPVAVLMHKGWEQIVASLAVMKAGAPYLPVDASLPPKRIETLIEDATCEVALTQAGLAALGEGRCRVIEVDRDRLRSVEGSRAVVARDPGEIAYVIYTSGSTGRPKGVVIDHRGAVNTVLDINRRFAVSDRDRVFALSSFSFDLSVYDVFGTFAAGGTVVLPSPSQVSDAGAWLGLVERHRVSVWNSVPALMSLLVDYCEASSRDLASLDLVMLSGDWIPVDLPERVRRLQPSCRVIGLGGATEASIWSIFYPVTASVRHLPSVPYGWPLANQTFHVLDEGLEPCPDWVPGSLYIGGVGVAKGYWERPDLTSKSFIETAEHGRLYRTGDIGRYVQDGLIEFLGREDAQVKVQGHRVELGEIETTLGSHPAVKSALVVVDRDAHLGSRLLAYVVPEAASHASRSEEAAAPPMLSSLERSLFKLQQRSVRHLDPDLPRVALPKVETVAGFPMHTTHLPGGGRARPTIAELGRILAALRQVDVPDAPLPKYFYPSASSLYPVQLYVDVPEGEDALAAGFYYYSSAENALVRLSDAGRARGAALRLHWVADMDAIAPMYPAHEARRFVFLEAGHIEALLASQAAALDIGLASHWQRETDVSGNPALPSNALCLGYSEFLAPMPAPSVEPSRLFPVGQTKRVPLPAADPPDRLEYDVLKRQSFREFAEGRVASSALSGALSALASHLDESIEILVLLKPGRSELLASGWFVYDRDTPSLVPLRVDERDAERLFAHENAAVFHGGAFAVFVVGRGDAAAGDGDRALIRVGRASQALQSYAWKIGLGFCPIGAIDQALLDDLLGPADGLSFLQGFVGGPIAEPQLAEWGVGAAGQVAAGPEVELERFLAERLPAYMVPKIYIPIEAVPLTPNGKVDRKALPRPRREERASASQRPPKNDIERALVALVGEELELETVGVQDNFFKLGGNSLIAMRIASRLQLERQVELSLRTFFESPTIAELAARIGGPREPGERELPDIYEVAASVSSRGAAPLTYGQRHIFAHCEVQENDSAYNITTALEIDGELSVEALRATLQLIVDRHDALRTTFAYADGGVVQVVAPRQEVAFEEVRLAAPSESERREEVERLIELESRAPFDLFRGHMLRCKLLAVSRQRHVIVLSVHHVVADYLSMEIIARELESVYRSKAAGAPVELPELKLQYGDFVRWQERFLESRAGAEQIAYWQRALDRLPPQALPDDAHPATGDAGDGAGRWLEYSFGGTAYHALKRRCEELDMSMFAMVMAGLQRLISYETGQQDVAVGTPVSTRFNPDLENVVGLMLNTLLVRVDAPLDCPRDTFLAAVKEAVLNALDHKDVPLELVQEKLGRPGPLYRVRYVYRAIRGAAEAEVAQDRVAALEASRADSKFDLLVALNDHGDRLAGEFEYRAARLKPQTVERMSKELTLVLEWLARTDGETLGELGATLERERAATESSRRHGAKARNAERLLALRGGRG